MTAAERQREISRCHEEIAKCKADVATDIGALIGLRDWTRELRLLEAEAYAHKS